jgi:predicted nucleic acid-binding protein
MNKSNKYNVSKMTINSEVREELIIDGMTINEVEFMENVFKLFLCNSQNKIANFQDQRIQE